MKFFSSRSKSSRDSEVPRTKTAVPGQSPQLPELKLSSFRLSSATRDTVVENPSKRGSFASLFFKRHSSTTKPSETDPSVGDMPKSTKSSNFRKFKFLHFPKTLETVYFGQVYSRGPKVYKWSSYHITLDSNGKSKPAKSVFVAKVKGSLKDFLIRSTRTPGKEIF